MLCFGVCDVLVVTADEDVAYMDNVMEKSTCFMGDEEFLFSNRVLQLHIVEFARKGADDLLSAVHFPLPVSTLHPLHTSGRHRGK